MGFALHSTFHRLEPKSYSLKSTKLATPMEVLMVLQESFEVPIRTHFIEISISWD